MFKALMGGGRSSSDVRSTTSSSSKSARRKTDSKSTHSRKSSRGDDRDRGLGDLSAYSPSASGSKRGAPSIAGDSVASTYVTAEPDTIDDSDPVIIERTPRRRDSDRESKSGRRRDRDRSESRERERRKSRRGTADGLDDDLDRERDRRERRRTKSGDPYMPSSTPGAQFAADIAAPGFSQFPMQYDNALPPGSGSPGHDPTPAPFDPHVHQQFPGQFPSGTAEPYFPPNPAGAAADYYGDQGQSVSEQPGIRPHLPPVIPNSQAHLMTASPSANPPPEPSSLGEVGAAASYFDDDFPVPESQSKPPSGSSSKPPKPGKISKPPNPGKPSKPNKPSASSVLPAAAAGAATYGIGDAMMSSHGETESSTTINQHSTSYSQPAATSTSKPPHTYGIGTGIGTAAAGAAAGYMLGHQHHSSSPPHSSQYSYQNFEQSSQAGLPSYGSAPNNAMLAAGATAYSAHPAHNPGYYPGVFAMQHRHRGPFTKFVDFWRDPEGVGRFEDYTETIGVCKYCFEPGTSSVDAPRKHHYHGRRHSADRYSSGSSRVNKLSRYQSSEDESRRRKRSKKSSWFPEMLAGYTAKSIFTGKDFDDSYSVRSGRVGGERVSSHDDDHASLSDRRSYTSRGVVRRSGRTSPGEYGSDYKYNRRTRSRSRSSSRSGRHSFVKEAALGAAVGSAALAVSKSHQRSRSRSPSRIQRRKESSSSSSLLDVSRPPSKSVGGITSFFTSSSENRKKKKSSKKRRGFFSFNSSSSSSLDADLAFGSGFAKKFSSSKSSSPKSKKKAKKGEDVDAALLGLGATATALAASSPGRGRSTGKILSRSRHSYYNSSANEDEEWVDAESEDQSSSSSAHSALAFGGSSAESGSDSSRGGWGWRWGGKKKKKDKKSSATDAALAAGAGALGGAALASVARHRDSRVSSSSGSLQQVYPVPTSDPSRFDAVKMSPSVMSGSQPPLVRPGPIPLQQPQPVTPVSPAVYTTQGGLPSSIPAYSAPTVPPIFANEYARYDPQLQGRRDPLRSQEDASFVERRKPHRSESSPVFSSQETSTSNSKRRSPTKDQASVSFDLTEEQAERERRLSRRDRKSWEEFRDEPVQLIDREDEFARRDSERRDHRRQNREEEKRRSDAEREKDSSSWVEAAAVGAIGAAAASSLVSRKKDDDEVSEATLRRREERREQRRAERRRTSGQDVDSSIMSKSDIAQPVEETAVAVPSKDAKDKYSSRPSPRPAPVYEDYAEFYAPEELRHSPDQHSKTYDSGETPNIVEVVPASERQARDLAKDLPDNLPQFGPEPYENHDRLPWQVPRLNFIEPTPPQSINGSVRGTSSPSVPVDVPPDVPVEKAKEPELPKERERSSAGSRVSWGEHSTHEYEVPSSSEHEISPLDESPREFPVVVSGDTTPKDIGRKQDVGADIEFAATIAAATEAAGFDPSVVTNDPKYHTRTSPPGSEDEGTFSPRSTWATPKDRPHGFVDGEVGSYEVDKSREIGPLAEHVLDDKPFYSEPESITQEKDVSSPTRRDRGSIAQEVIERLNGKTPRSDSPENDVFSMPGGFDTVDDSQEILQSRDDSRSAFSAPAVRELDKSTKSRKSRRSGDNFDLPRETREIQDTPSSPPEQVDVDADEDKKKRRKRRSKRDSDTFSVDDDARSAVTEVQDEDKSERRKHRHRSSTRDGDVNSVDDDARSTVTDYRDDKSERRKHRHRSSTRDSDTFSVDSDTRSAVTEYPDEGKSERRKHRHRSSRDSGFDDTASISSSPAKFDQSREKRRSKDEKEKDKSSSSSFLRGLFGSRVSAPEERAQSSSLDKRSSREAISEAGIDDERRRRKKHSSRHRSSSRGGKLNDDESDKDERGQDDTNLEDYRSHRQRKEERRRHRYEEIVESGKRKDSEKV
ncbi:uncharacterized protein N7459_002049 [Penicillium hispanicum]|uniref:uncharacterized protein n=1 Tax=Penicillium hispanicum TaxID=1080232 RepID=UPI0025424B59|nr:uncharacterized protein N7459_002049 [Penicillium hispanicum]KAJ5591680.1 hypothetical protein N7459_002049 [Penicillium hispanicum]